MTHLRINLKTVSVNSDPDSSWRRSIRSPSARVVIIRDY